MEPDADQSNSTGGAGQTAGPLLQTGQIVAGKYQIEATLGKGGMGAVYQARNVRTRKSWALKVLHPEMSGRPDVLQRFWAEAQAAGMIGHPGIVEIIDQDHDGNLHFLVMPKLDGEELSARIVRGHPLPVDFVMRVGADVADAIAAAHRAKIIHRDLKPANVFLANKDGRRDVVQILDFGIAKLKDDGSMGPSLTQTRDVYGTPHYMSPEQLRSAKDVDERTDIYAIGVILYEALAGHTPYQADSFPDLVVRIMTEEPPALETLRSDIPPGLAAIVKRAMARDRDARFPSAEALRDALLTCARTSTSQQEALAQTIAASGPLPAWISDVKVAPKPNRGRSVAWLAAAGGVGMAVGGVLYLRREPPGPGPAQHTLATGGPAAEGKAINDAGADAVVVQGGRTVLEPPTAHLKSMDETPPESNGSRHSKAANKGPKTHPRSSSSSDPELPELKPR